MASRYGPTARRGALLAKATLSPGGLIVGGVLATIGLLSGIGIPWVIAAAVAAWGTTTGLALRDPKLVRGLLAPQFDRDLGALDREHLGYMTAAFAARDRFEQATADMPREAEFGGMQARLKVALEQLYDSVVWAQRADVFLRGLDEAALRERLRRAPRALAGELQEQVETVDAIRARRDDTLARIAATTTGIETLAVKVAGLALGTGTEGPEQDVAALRHELDAYVDGLAEIEAELKLSLPPSA